MNDKAFIAQRFKELKRAKRFKSGRWLVSEMGLPPYTVNKILAGKVVSASDEIHFSAILKKIGVSEEEFFGKAPTAPPTTKAITATAKSTGLVPLYGEIPAGNPAAKEGMPEPDEWVESVPGLKGGKVFALRVHGVSMAPYLLPGDTVYLEPLDLELGFKDPSRPAPRLLFERLHNRIVAALLDNEATLKVLRVTPKPNSDDYDLHLVPLNPQYRELYIRPDSEVRFQGVVVKTLRDESLPAWTLFKGEKDVSAGS